MNHKLLLVCAAALFATGCVLPPKEAPQQAPIDTAGLGLGAQAAPRAADGWWKVFGDAQLDRLVDEALARNPGLAEALARVRGAQAQAVAAGAPLRPGLTLDGEETRQRLSENYIYPPAQYGFAASGGNMAWLGQLGLNLNWDLDFWGRQASLLREARAQQRAAELDQVSARSIRRTQLVEHVADAADDLDVLPLVVAADIVRFTDPAAFDDQVERACMILDL